MDDWLCIVTSKKIFGIKLSNLKEFVDWEFVPSSSEFDFSMDTKGAYSVPFQFDSKIYFGAGYERFSLGGRGRGRGRAKGYVDDYIDNCKIYEFDIVEDEDEQGMISASGKLIEASIPDSPYQLDGFFIANIDRDVYFLSVSTRKMLIFALRSGTRTWQSLSLPCRQFCDDDYFWRESSEFRIASFVFNNKIFTYFSPRYGSGSDDMYFFCSLDPAADKAEECGWVLKDRTMLESFNIDPYERPCYPQITVSVPGLKDDNHSVTLSWLTTSEENPEQSKVAIIALLGNEKGVVSYQQLDECFGWIEHSFEYFTIINKIFQLENGEVCALVWGRLVELNGIVLCISIFKLCKDSDSSMTGNAGEQTRFLSVHVIRKSVYLLEDCLFGAFSLPSKQNKLLTNLNHNRKARE